MNGIEIFHTYYIDTAENIGNIVINFYTV